MLASVYGGGLQSENCNCIQKGIKHRIANFLMFLVSCNLTASLPFTEIQC